MCAKERELFCGLLWRIWLCRNSYVHGSSKADMSDMVVWSEMFVNDYQSNSCGKKQGVDDTFQSEDAPVVKWINDGLRRDTDYGNILSDIDDMSTHVRGMSFCHVPPQANKAARVLQRML
ncbi:hypothetical protein Dsin_017922 [Dipteronia sinensis]|uniref:RNase H type-1 domain-containing protein n=1 Tax=Dipteronia sinensis TaxID=43782 RepID=A0AAE0E6W9_9ROSI|nr:hypothetical protein Dsin_017922 [Dipteronia sinensis]